MGNSICASSRKCQENGEMFGMLCKRPYEKPVLVKFENETHLLDLVEKRNQERKESRF